MKPILAVSVLVTGLLFLSMANGMTTDVYPYAPTVTANSVPSAAKLRIARVAATPLVTRLGLGAAVSGGLAALWLLRRAPKSK